MKRKSKLLTLLLSGALSFGAYAGGTGSSADSGTSGSPSVSGTPSGSESSSPQSAPGVGGMSGSPGSGSASTPSLGGSMTTSTDIMNELDKDKDGYLSSTEASEMSGIQSQFSQLDKDSDGKLSSTELLGADLSAVGGMSGSSGSGTGSTDSTSSSAGMSGSTSGSTDSTSSSGMTSSEAATGTGTTAGTTSATGATGSSADSAASSTGGMSSSDTTASTSVDIMQQLDDDKDGYVTRSEAQRFPGIQSQFKSLDSDNDDKLSASELSGVDLTAVGRPETDKPEKGEAGASRSMDKSDDAGKSGSKY